MHRFSYIFVLLFVLVSCSHIDEPEQGDIMLSAVVDNISVVTKADGDSDAIKAPDSVFMGSEPSSDNPLAVDLWFSESSGVYKNDPQGTTMLPCKSKITYYSPSPDYPDLVEDQKIKYNRVQQSGANDYPYAYCVGFYPQTPLNGIPFWTVSDDGKTASATIDGKTDLMYAPQISGNWTHPFGPQTYSHLLTWLKVCVCATDSAAVSVWGDIEDISVKSVDDYPVYTKVNVDLSSGEVSYPSDSKASSGFSFLDGVIFSLGTVIKETGSVLCSPSAKYTLHIETSAGIEKDVLIDLKDMKGIFISSANDAVGKMFVITLYFNPFNVIEGVCTLNSWNNEDEELELK